MEETYFSKISLGEHIVHTSSQFLNRPALWVNQQTYTYGGILDLAKSLAGTIQSFECPSRNVAIFSYRSAWAYISMLGTLLAGKTYVPLTPKFPVDRNRKIASMADVRIFCIDKRCEKQAAEWIPFLDSDALVLFPEHDSLPEWCQKNTQHKYLCAPDILSPQKPSHWSAPEELVDTDNAYILFTSGTTGEPKGIAVSHKNILSYLHTFQQTWPVKPDDRCTQIYEQTFDVSVHDLFSCWQAGACLYVIPETAQLCPVGFINQHQLTRWGSVPSLLTFIKRFGKMTPNAMPSITFSIFSGEALPSDMAREWSEACPNSRIFNMYGPTEATIHITAYEWSPESDGGNLPIGKPFSGQEVAIINSQGKLVSPGEKGELLLAGSQITNGYWKAPERTREHFVELSIPGKSGRRWYRTGDLVSERDDQNLLIHGRKDFQVKVNGYRIELDEITNTLRRSVACIWAAAVPWPIDPNTSLATGVVAWLGGDNPDTLSEIDIKRRCGKLLPAYMVPSRIFWAEELPRNASGKIDIRRLQQMSSDALKTPPSQ